MLNPSNMLRQPGLATSLALHLFALICAVMFVRATLLPDVSEQAISVEIVPLSQVTGAAPALAELTTPASPVPRAETATPEQSTTDMVHATEMLTGRAFADPRNAEARQMLSSLDVGTLREQLCGIEALEQIAANQPLRHPQAIVAYAFAETRVEGVVMTADGAAVQIGSDWRKLRFVCTLAPDLSAVVALDFAVGDIIPESEWDRYGLAMDGDE